MISSTHTTCNECPNHLLCGDQGECLAAQKPMIARLTGKIAGVFTGEDARKRCEGLSAAQIVAIANRDNKPNVKEQTTPPRP